jgi:hypothetical protein
LKEIKRWEGKEGGIEVENESGGEGGGRKRGKEVERKERRRGDEISRGLGDV